VLVKLKGEWGGLVMGGKLETDSVCSGLVKGVAQAPDISPADIDTMFSTNVTGLINMTQAILPIFKARPDGGRGDIINIGSIAGRESYQGGSIYCATKAAVRSFTDAMRRELIATRIRVMEIDPGQVETEFSIVRFGGDKEKAKKVYEGVDPLTPDDIAEVVVFAAGRRENVVLADTLVFPNHQVSGRGGGVAIFANVLSRLLRRLCIGSLLVNDLKCQSFKYVKANRNNRTSPLAGLKHAC
jgi:NAD(P)-dependent dehydrogenase (short-subunit alcohol dehydrogenase family)